MLKRVASVGILILLVGVVVFVFTSTSKNNKINESRVTVFDQFETTKQWIVSDVKNILTIDNEKTWRDVKANSHMDDSLKKEVFGDKYDPINFTNHKSVTVTDAQYEIQSEVEGVVSYYIMVYANDGELRKKIDILVTVKNNTITDILLF